MSGVNKAIIVGNLGQDPEVNHTGNNVPVANFSLATSEKWKDKNTGEQVEKTEWHRIVVWRRLAEIAQKYLHKGDKVYVEGRLETRKWTDKSGSDRYTTEIVANRLEMLGSKQSTGGGGDIDDRQRQAPADDDLPF